jgi:hypothetical protein
MDLVQPLGETAHDPFVDSDELHLVEIRRRPRAHSGLRRLASDLLANRAMKSPPYNSAPAIDIAAYRSLGGRIIMSVTVPVDLRLIGAVVNDLALDDLHAQRRRQDENQTVGCIKKTCVQPASSASATSSRR